MKIVLPKNNGVLRTTRWIHNQTTGGVSLVLHGYSAKLVLDAIAPDGTLEIEIADPRAIVLRKFARGEITEVAAICELQLLCEREHDERE